jgi:hypothetical protein
MTDTQHLVILATVYMAPHFHPVIGNVIGVSLFIFASFKGLGWV